MPYYPPEKHDSANPYDRMRDRPMFDRFERDLGNLREKRTMDGIFKIGKVDSATAKGLADGITAIVRYFMKPRTVMGDMLRWGLLGRMLKSILRLLTGKNR